tara:strand:+ start:310 stop:561 length:252 start_codon:yes stop_codon:yes gene_type:complete
MKHQEQLYLQREKFNPFSFFLFTSQIIQMKKRIQSPQHARSVIKTVSHLTRVDIIESSEVYYSLMQEAGATAKDYELVSNLLD